ncbi:MAG: hypothetical protein GY700_06460 [Propionibacteriaceae bacterium]|nr:hypothetical protein [Propionibacteriaceae bacterium]
MSEWSKTPPSEPGYYYWREEEGADYDIYEAYLLNGRLVETSFARPMGEGGGEWWTTPIPGPGEDALEVEIENLECANASLRKELTETIETGQAQLDLAREQIEHTTQQRDDWRDKCRKAHFDKMQLGMMGGHDYVKRYLPIPAPDYCDSKPSEKSISPAEAREIALAAIKRAEPCSQPCDAVRELAGYVKQLSLAASFYWGSGSAVWRQQADACSAIAEGEE